MIQLRGKCIDCDKLLYSEHYATLKRCERCYLKYAISAPCHECGMVFTGDAIDTENDEGVIERFHPDCWQIAADRYSGVDTSYSPPPTVVKKYQRLNGPSKQL